MASEKGFNLVVAYYSLAVSQATHHKRRKFIHGKNHAAVMQGAKYAGYRSETIPLGLKE